MAVNIQHATSTVRSVDGNSLLTPEVMKQIIDIVMQVVDERMRDQQRERATRRVTPGVAYELEHEE
ncbi:MAG TPA: hypothetical protein VMC09_11485 [Anaerolineales bacterium]|nr:hypothetical protein [Anaerolineales bacterium]